MSVILSKLTRPKEDLWVEVQLDRLQSNLHLLRQKLKPQTGVLAVIKANAYGHGYIPIAKALSSQVEYLGVTEIREAVSLREARVMRPILVFGFWSPQDVEWAARYDFALTISSLEEAIQLEEILSEMEAPQKLKVHVKVDTGMNRLGFSYTHAGEEILKLRDFSHLEFEGIFTHFAVADCPASEFTAKQLARFQDVLSKLEQQGFSFKWRHAANSAGLLNFSDSHFNLVRPGLSLYGIFHDEGLGLKPVLTWKTRIRLIREIQAGETVSYGQKFQAKDKTRIAILPVGYSQGYPYSFSGKAEVIIRGERRPVAGQVCMDYTMVDIGEKKSFNSIDVGDEVVLLGPGDDEPGIDIKELAAQVGTIPYELVVGIRPSIPRFYID